MSDERRRIPINVEPEAAEEASEEAAEQGEEQAEEEEGRRDYPEGFDALAAAAELDASLGEEEREREAAPDRGAERGGGERDYVAMLEQEVESLNALVEKKDAEVERLREQIDDSLEEVSRSRDRLGREARREAEERVQKVLTGFLEVLDDLDRALAAAREGGGRESVLEGVELVRSKFLSALAEQGVRHRPALGEPFDPEHHDAISTQAVEDPSQAGKVVGVVQEGYDIGDRTLRPARVVVGKAG